jgi:Zn-dependent protease with chaperone function
MGLVMGFAFLLSLHSVPIIYEVAEIALALLMLSFISWRAERRADLEGARGAGPEGLISVLELLKSKTKRDEGSETHPPCADRIKKLMKMLDEENVDEETNEI